MKRSQNNPCNSFNQNYIYCCTKIKPRIVGHTKSVRGDIDFLLVGEEDVKCTPLQRVFQKSRMTLDTQIESLSEHIYTLIQSTLEEGQADDIVTLDIRRRCSLADYMVIASGRSVRHIWSLTKDIVERLHKIGIRKVSVEGTSESEWVVIDTGDIVIHLFRPKLRSFYDLERFWNDTTENAQQIFL